MTSRFLGFILVLSLAACGRDAVVAPPDEVDLALAIGSQAEKAMGGTEAGPQAILRNLVQQVRVSDNAEAKARLVRGEEMARRADESGDQDLAVQAHALILQAVTLVFPNAATRVATAVRAGLDRAQSALGTRDAPRIRAALDQVAALLRQSAEAQSTGRVAIALDLALRASEMLSRLSERVRTG
jgi:hypothetical protein